MSYQCVKVTREGPIAILSFNRPEAMNALSTQTARDLIAALEELELDDAVFAAVLTAEGDKAFCVGADINCSRPYSINEDRYIIK